MKASVSKVDVNAQRNIKLCTAPVLTWDLLREVTSYKEQQWFS